MASAAQIENQINANYDTIGKVEAQLLQSPPVGKRALLLKELHRLWQAQKYWAAEYKKTTGHTMEVMPTMFIEESVQAVQAQNTAASLTRQLQAAIVAVRRDHERIDGMLQSQYDIALQWQHVIFSHWVRLGAGLDARHPLIIKKLLTDNVAPALREAEVMISTGKLEKASSKIGFAARTVKWGFESYNWWISRLEVGAARAESAIKVSAGVATAACGGWAAAGGLELGIGATALIAGTGELAGQATTMTAKVVTGDQAVTLEDAKKAAIEVGIAASAAAVGKLANVLASGLTPMIASKISKTPLSQAATSAIADRIEQYVSANAPTIIKKVFRLEQEPTWNWWYALIAPAIGPIPMELVKEQNLNDVARKGVMR